MFSDIIVKLLEKNRITAYKLSKDLGISEALISNWKSGRQEPKYDNLQKLSKYFNVSADYLLEIDNTDPENLSYKQPTDKELQQQIKDNMQKLNSQGLMRLADYSNDLVSSGNYEKKIPSLKIARTAPGNPYVQPYMEDEEDLSKYPETDMDL